LAAASGGRALGFRSLAETICDGAIACTILNFERRRITEGDILFEKDISDMLGALVLY
jgi:hypothetical protein